MTVADAEVATPLLIEWIAQGHQAWLRISGRSMRPWLPDGSRVLLAPAATADIRAGDVIVYQAEGGLICHRSLGRSASTFAVKGDAWSLPIATVDADRIVGRVIALERRGRRRDTDRGIARLEAGLALMVGRLAAQVVRVRRRWRRLRRGPA